MSFPQQAIIANRFQARAQLGYASLGWLYRAYDPQRGNDVALRVVLNARNANASYERLRSHIGLLSVVKHPGIAKVWDCGVHEGQLWFSSEWVTGRPLDHQVSPTGPLPVAIVKRVGIALADALGEAHRHGLVHRGLKPRNVFVDGDRASVLELGVGAAIFADSGVVANTPSSMPREQMMNGAVDHRSDIYSLGACLFTAVVGRPAFDGGPHDMMAAQAGWKAPRARDLNPAVPEAMELLLLRSMATRPEDRFQSMDELSDALQRLQPDGRP